MGSGVRYGDIGKIIQHIPAVNNMLPRGTPIMSPTQSLQTAHIVSSRTGHLTLIILPSTDMRKLVPGAENAGPTMSPSFTVVLDQSHNTNHLTRISSVHGYIHPHVHCVACFNSNRRRMPPERSVQDRGDSSLLDCDELRAVYVLRNSTSLQPRHGCHAAPEPIFNNAIDEASFVVERSDTVLREGTSCLSPN